MIASSRAPIDVSATLRRVGIIPVIRARSSDSAVMVATTLLAAGLPVAEITMTVPGALTAIAALSEQRAGGLLVGAGTVTNAEDAQRAIDAGAEFIVSPCVVPSVIAVSRAAGVVVIAGALTPTEVFAAWDAGADIVKVFPVHSLGGAAYIRALGGPFPMIPLVPTGGVTVATIGDYVRAGVAAVGVGGELVTHDALERGDYAAIASLARQFVRAVHVARGG
jgi:2-dehydro-3-deoxyphosphogluconate aldolase/(4S)-4-hydroxy-2-oxoglutarate aldolase